MLIGEIGRPQGLQGEVRIRSFTAHPAAIAEYGPLEDETSARLFEIESLRVTPKALSARLKGVTSRDEAEALTGTKLYVPHSRLPAREEDEWYHTDLIGISALDREGEGGRQRSRSEGAKRGERRRHLQHSWAASAGCQIEHEWNLGPQAFTEHVCNLALTSS